MVAASYSFDLFSRVANPARTKVILLGSANLLPVEVMDRVRSLHIEHVSPALLMRRGISRPRPSVAAREAATLALLRHWFWTRKPDAGFLLTEFPATMLQAQVFDEWIEARNEALDVVVCAPDSPEPVVSHYRDIGLLHEPAEVQVSLR